jgi:hypothetical protein
MFMTFKVQLMVRVLVDVLLRNGKFKSGDKSLCTMKRMTNICRVYISFIGAVEPVLGFTRPRKIPDSERVVSASSHDQGTLRPFLLANISMFIFDIDPFGFDDSQTANGTCVTAKNVGATPGGEVPNTDGPIRGPTDESVFGRCEGPHTALMSRKGA